MKPLLHLLRRPLLHVAGLSFFVNLLLLAPATGREEVTLDRVNRGDHGTRLKSALVMVGCVTPSAFVSVANWIRAAPTFPPAS